MNLSDIKVVANKNLPEDRVVLKSPGYEVLQYVIIDLQSGQVSDTFEISCDDAISLAFKKATGKLSDNSE